MRFNWKLAGKATLLAAGWLLAAGCSGVQTQQSVSPASFFLPGLLQVQPPLPVVGPQVVQAN